MKIEIPQTQHLKLQLSAELQEARRELDTHKQNVAVLKRNISMIKRHIKLAETEFLKGIQNRADNKESLSTIAKEFGVSRTAVVNWLRLAATAAPES
jgi:GTP-sensing pleiotropic transcriptional regulator CodY